MLSITFSIPAFSDTNICSGEPTITDPGKVIASPNYPNEYENNFDCHVTVRYVGSRVRLQLVDVAIEYYRLYIRCHLATGLEREHHCKLPTDWLEIRDDNSTNSKLIAKIAGQSSWPTGHSTGLLDVSKKHPTFFKEIPEIESSGEFMTIVFHSNDKIDRRNR